MRIAIIVRLLWPGGVQRIAIEEARGLQQLGHDVLLLFLRRSSLPCDYSLQDLSYRVANEGYRDSFTRFMLRHFTHVYAPQRGPQATIDLDLIIKESLKLRGFDAVIFHDQFAGIGGFVRKILQGEPYYLYIHETLLSRPNLQAKFMLPFALEKEVLKNANYIFTNSKANAEALKRVTKNVEILYQGCHPKSIDIINNVKKDRIALSVALWDFGRRPNIYLEIAKRLNIGRLILAGSWVDSKQELAFRELVKKKGVRNLEVTGPISEKALNELYLKSRVFIRFGFHELGFGQGCLEAISFGLPIITNKGLGISEIVMDGVHGFVFDDIDYDLVAEKIEIFFTNDEIFETMKLNIIKLSNKLSWNSHVKKLNSILLHSR